MRRVQILDSLLSERLESLQSSSTFETGLLLAQSGSQADTVLHLIPTPSSDEDGSAPGSVDASWMMTHADAVSHMLPGGIAVLGAYLFSPCAKFPALEVKLRPVLAAALKRLNGVDEAQAVLLLLPTDARKASARVLAANSPSMKPLELNTISTPPQLHCLEATWSFTAQLWLQPADGGGPAQLAQLRRQMAPTLALLEATEATIGGVRHAAGATFSQLALCGPQQPHQVRLFHPVNCLEADGGDDPPLGTATSVATVRLAGLVRGRAFAGGKDRVCDGLRSLRRDLARTVDRRLVLLLDEVAEEEGCDSRSPLPAGEARSWPLPRRAHFEVEGGLSLCDYVTEGEDTSEFGDKVAEVLGGQLAPTTGGSSNADLEALLWPEAPAHKAPAPPQDDSQRAAAAPPPGKAPAPAARDVASVLAPGKGKQGGLPLAAIAAIAIAVAAVAAASLFTILGTAGGGDLAASVNVGEARGVADEMGAGEGV